MTLFSDPACPYCHRVRLVVAEKRINCDIVDVEAGELPDEVREANPYETLPTLVDRELSLYDSRIIMEYLDERFPHPPMLPVDPVGRAQARLLMHRLDLDWYGLMRDVLKDDSKAMADGARRRLRDILTAAEPIFSANRFFMGAELSLVDCIVAPLLWRLPVLRVVLPGSAIAVKSYAARIFESSAFRRSLTETEREMVADNRSAS